MRPDQNRRIVHCRGCGQSILWMRTSTGSRMPVDLEGIEETDQVFDPKRHTSHFATCPKADEFRRPRKPKKENP